MRPPTTHVYGLGSLARHISSSSGGGRDLGRLASNLASILLDLDIKVNFIMLGWVVGYINIILPPLFQIVF